MNEWQYQLVCYNCLFVLLTFEVKSLVNQSVNIQELFCDVFCIVCIKRVSSNKLQAFPIVNSIKGGRNGSQGKEVGKDVRRNNNCAYLRVEVLASIYLLEATTAPLTTVPNVLCTINTQLHRS